MNVEMLRPYAPQIALVVGFGIGYLTAVQLLNKKYDERLRTELEATARFQRELREVRHVLDEVEEELEEVKDTRPELTPDTEKLKYHTGSKHDVAVEVEIADEIDFDYNAEIAKRTPDKAYVITVDEFSNKPHNLQHEDICLTLYKDDEVLADDQGHPINDEYGVVGHTIDELIQKIGYGSSDPRIVYIRNEKLGADYEVTAFSGTYTESVFGIQPD